MPTYIHMILSKIIRIMVATWLSWGEIGTIFLYLISNLTLVAIVVKLHQRILLTHVAQMSILQVNSGVTWRDINLPLD